jgi:beta-xylosidase
MAEGAHITRRNGYYYIMCAEGGTGYGHCVTLGRARHILGPYEKDPHSPLLTSARAEDLQKPVHIEKTSASAFDKDYLRRQCFNPASALQNPVTPAMSKMTMGMSSWPTCAPGRCFRNWPVRWGGRPPFKNALD